MAYQDSFTRAFNSPNTRIRGGRGDFVKAFNDPSSRITKTSPGTYGPIDTQSSTVAGAVGAAKQVAVSNYDSANSAKRTDMWTTGNSSGWTNPGGTTGKSYHPLGGVSTTSTTPTGEYKPYSGSINAKSDYNQTLIDKVGSLKPGRGWGESLPGQMYPAVEGPGNPSWEARNPQPGGKYSIDDGKMRAPIAPTTPPQITPLPAQLPTPPTSQTIPFKPGVTPEQQQRITDLTKKPREQWTETDKNNWLRNTGGAQATQPVPAPVSTTPPVATAPAPAQPIGEQTKLPGNRVPAPANNFLQDEALLNTPGYAAYIAAGNDGTPNWGGVSAYKNSTFYGKGKGDGFSNLPSRLPFQSIAPAPESTSPEILKKYNLTQEAYNDIVASAQKKLPVDKMYKRKEQDYKRNNRRVIQKRKYVEKLYSRKAKYNRSKKISSHNVNTKSTDKQIFNIA